MVDLERYRATSGERNFIEQMKAPIFLEAVLAIMQETQYNLEEKVNLNILKDNFSPRTNASIFTSKAPSVIRLVKQNQSSFSSTEINKPLPSPVHSVL